MTAYTKDSDIRLIRAARQLLPEEGCAGLNLRKVARKAHVNLGMFHYHFRSKAAFKRRVLETMYNDFFEELSREKSSALDSLEKLRQALIIFGKFTRDHRKLLSSLANDVLSGDPVVTHFMTKNFPRHIQFISALISQCQKERKLVKIPTMQALAFLASSVNLPNLLTGSFERLHYLRGITKPATLQRFIKHSVKDEVIIRRIDMALKGLST